MLFLGQEVAACTNASNRHFKVGCSNPVPVKHFSTTNPVFSCQLDPIYNPTCALESVGGVAVDRDTCSASVKVPPSACPASMTVKPAKA